MTAVPDELYERIVSLLRTLVSACKSCFRPKSACYGCDLRLVGHLMERLEKETGRVRTSDRDMRFDAILEELKAAGRPLKAYEIDRGKRICARGLKHWTLHRMVELGMLEIVKGTGKQALYGIIKTERKDENGQGRDDEEALGV